MPLPHLHSSLCFADQVGVQEIVFAYLAVSYESTSLEILKCEPQSVVMISRSTRSAYLHPSSLFHNKTAQQFTYLTLHTVPESFLPEHLCFF